MNAVARVVSGLLSCLIAKRLIGGRGAGSHHHARDSALPTRC
jgi:hypothetical protein